MEINDELEMLGRAAFEAMRDSGADLDGARTWRDYFRPLVNTENSLDFYADHVSESLQEMISSQDEEINRLEDEVTRLEDILEENGIEY